MTPATSSLTVYNPPTDPLLPKSFEGMVELSERAANSQMLPKMYWGKPDMVLVGMLYAAGLGLHPIVALSNIAMINGKPTVWGDAVAAIPIIKGLVLDWVEWEEGTPYQDGWTFYCKVQKANGEWVQRDFSWEKAKRAHLARKDGTWQTYTDRMMMARAKGYAFRDAAPHAFFGAVIDRAPEEFEDDQHQGPDSAIDITPQTELREEPSDQPQSFDDVIEGILAGAEEEVRYDPETGVIEEPEIHPRDFRGSRQFRDELDKASGQHGYQRVSMIELEWARRMDQMDPGEKKAAAEVLFAEHKAKALERLQAQAIAELEDAPIIDDPALDPAEGHVDIDEEETPV